MRRDCLVSFSFALLCDFLLSISMPNYVAALNSIAQPYIRRGYRSSSCLQIAKEKCDGSSLYASRDDSPTQVKNIGIIGGGLAGMSCAYNLLQQTRGNPVRISIMDKASSAGLGGASSVAAG